MTKTGVSRPFFCEAYTYCKKHNSNKEYPIVIVSTVFRLTVRVLATVLGWVPLLGKLIKTQDKRNQFEQTFGVPYWHADAEEVSKKRLATLEAEWKKTGYTPSANKKYARCQIVAGFLPELRA